jgi:uncharacterized protein YprB with RNaseH-like and TPR domain
MRPIVFDIETSNIFDDVGRADPTLLDLALVGIYDFATNKYDSFLQDELPKLWPILEKADMLIGYNSLHFDLPLLNKYYSGNLGAIKHLDLMNEIKKSLGRRIGLGRVAKGTLGVGKSSDGLEALKWWKSGQIDKVRAYCLDDVKLTKEIYEYALENGNLRYVDGSETVEFPIDTSGWQDKQEKGITSTLPF